MEQRKIINSDISFADATLCSFDFEEQNQILNIFLEAWNAKVIKLHFESVLYFQYQPGDFISEIYQVTTESSIVKNALIKEFGKIPIDQIYKLILIDDISDISIIKIVCSNVFISVISEDK